MKPKLLSTLPGYKPAQFAADAFAGLTVAMVALPLSIAIAIASGADPATGLVTAIVAGFLISLLGGSRVQIGGPTGAFIVVVYSVIAQHGYDGLVLATLMAGVILVVAGLLRAGNLIAYVPEAVVNGFTIGIAIIIADQVLKARGAQFRMPVLAVAVGIYLPLELSTPIFLGGLLAHFADRARGAKPGAGEAGRESDKGVMFGAGMITGEALMGILILVQGIFPRLRTWRLGKDPNRTRPPFTAR